MKKTIQLVFITGVSIMLLAGCCAPRQVTQQWEYKVLTAHLYQELQPELTKAGEDGWEVVSAVNRDLHATVVLKRPKQ
jgi:hypothetical protein